MKVERVSSKRADKMKNLIDSEQQDSRREINKIHGAVVVMEPNEDGECNDRKSRCYQRLGE